MKNNILVLFALLPVLVCAQDRAAIPSGDGAIRRVDNCACYLAVEGQNLKPWELAWDDAEKLKKQVSHCVCETHIDLSKVGNPRRYVVPGTVLK